MESIPTDLLYYYMKLGVGVGNAQANPTQALLVHILQDTSGRIATIAFAHRIGPALEPECKRYRLAADVFNDAAMLLDCCSPLVPSPVGRVLVLSIAGVLRALCGVAGGSSKASLSAHFARWGNNLAEVNAVCIYIYIPISLIEGREEHISDENMTIIYIYISIYRKIPPKKPSFPLLACW